MKTEDEIGRVVLGLVDQLKKERASPVASLAHREAMARLDENLAPAVMLNLGVLKVDAFNHGYLVAVATMLHQHDCTVTAEDALRDSGLRLHHALELGIEEFDLSVLRPIFKKIEGGAR